ncbi:MAG TPA: hypothetical protein VMX97_01915 [Hyphomicrobiaceae bacterium]|nr:hypothetical protein [Hyphomicrobiaceae bacterium]
MKKDDLTVVVAAKTGTNKSYATILLVSLLDCIADAPGRVR